MGRKVIIFDLGGIIIDLHVDRTLKRMEILLGKDLMHFDEDHGYDSFFKEYEMGKIDSKAFSDHLKSFAKSEINDEELNQAWNAMLGEIPSERIKWIEELKKNYGVVLLSNTNKKHVV